MKKIIFIAACWPVFQYFNPAYAQKTKSKENGREIIIIKNGEKEKKLTIETKDGETFINGKPASEYKDDDVSVIKQKFRNGNNFSYAPGTGFSFFNKMDGEKKAFLGVTTEKADNGVKITNITKESAAVKAGLKEGDIITKLGNKKISDPEDLMDAVTSYKPKDGVKIYFTRNGKLEDVTATLGESNGYKTFSFGNSLTSPRIHINTPDADMFRNFDFKMPPITFPQNQEFTNILRFGNHRLGVRIEDAENNEGAKITNVQEGSAAEKAGLKKDDIITEINGKKIKDVGEALEQVRDNSNKESYTIRAKRNASEMNFDIKIPKRKNNADL